ncbi:hypothetical protein CLM71_23260 [Serratia sp. MYb239]|uniref:DUF943 family protein n=1 Tax=Serratia sp. MYb239 TaxID=2033438 RepID=UPI000CF6301A|nr:DUF943 family protein [Serratia sp. MYb239]AVJ19855.1 hypothetical protein CLM71_23260 [Serratia sp. MYb239]MCA4823412.1 DUF943 family protein [Serratia rubidaea]SQJ31880.1 Enterobacterial putative membrane protein (DUF943) [Serratia rubidaea]
MRVKNKKTIAFLTLAVSVLLGYWLWLSLRPVEVVAVHDNGNHSYVLVRSFPLTDKGKINWWLKNKDMLKAKYDIPKPSSSGYFTIIFWDFGDGYKEEGKYDRLCFDDMKTKVNCIEKDAVFSIDKSRNFGVTFTVYDGDNYRLGQNSDIIKVESN